MRIYELCPFQKRDKKKKEMNKEINYEKKNIKQNLENYYILYYLRGLLKSGSGGRSRAMDIVVFPTGVK